jgi:osmotically inducible protein OsmC
MPGPNFTGKETTVLIRKSTAEWQGNLNRGKGRMKSGSGSVDVAYSAGMRFDNIPGTNPEELIGAAHAGCFSMAFANELDKKGYKVISIETEARVELQKTDKGFTITTITLNTRAEIPEIDEQTFQAIAEQAKSGCPVSRALAGVKILLEALLTA